MMLQRLVRRGRRLIMSGAWRWIVLITIVIGVAGYFLSQRSQGPQSNSATQKSNQLLQRLVQKAGDHPTAALSNQSAPQPTNKWFSSLVYSKEPMPIYATPLSYKPTASGYEIGYSTPVVTPVAVTTPHTADIIVSYVDQVDDLVNSYDDLSVGVGYRQSNDTVGQASLTQGSPYVYGKTSKPLTINSPLIMSQINNTVVKLSSNGKTYIIKADNLKLTGQSVQIKDGDYLLAIVPTGATTEQMLAGSSPIVSTRTSMVSTNTGTTTTYSLRTANNQPTIWAPPLTENTTSSNLVGSLDTLLGNLKFYTGKAFASEVTSRPFVDSLTVNRLNDTDKQLIVRALKTDIAQTSFTENNTYGAGKQLYRAAQLLRLSQDLGEDEQAALIAGKLSAQLRLWLAPLDHDSEGKKTFYYDSTIKGIVGLEAAFGSEQFNDHYFHYGYIIYAAAELQRYDHSLTDQQQQMTALLIRDIASEQTDKFFPKLRHFDLYAGHSWASGYSVFGDGNNQESTSEALLAWSGIANWAQVTGDDSLLAQSQGLLDREANATEKIWLTPPARQGFSSPLVSLVWGSRLDYTTWFSGEPAAKLGIQLIPMAPTQQLMLQDTQRSRTQIAAIPSDNTIFRDYIAMYASTTSKDQSIDVITKLTDANIDSANSRAYALAWTLTR